MATPIVSPHDRSRHTMEIFLLSLERNDTKSLRACAGTVLRSAFDHLYSDYRATVAAATLENCLENGQAMCTLLVLLDSAAAQPRRPHGPCSRCREITEGIAWGRITGSTIFLCPPCQEEIRKGGRP